MEIPRKLIYLKSLITNECLNKLQQSDFISRLVCHVCTDSVIESCCSYSINSLRNKSSICLLLPPLIALTKPEKSSSWLVLSAGAVCLQAPILLLFHAESVLSAESSSQLCACSNTEGDAWPLGRCLLAKQLFPLVDQELPDTLLDYCSQGPFSQSSRTTILKSSEQQLSQI